MRTFVTVFTGCLLSTSGLLALAPGVTSIQNPASNIVPGLPNYGIAQGSIFVLYGSQLGPATIAIAQSLPYQTTLPGLAGTSVKITAGGLVTNAPIIYTLNTQVAAVMPSNTVVGPATIQVTYNGFQGSPFSTTIVANNFGISTVNQTGTGAAVVTYPNSTPQGYGLVSQTNSAIPGNTYTMWGTGLGAATAGNSDINANAFANVGPQAHVVIGGVEASVTYYGRSPGAGPGLDQINFTIPAGLSGCNVSLLVQTTGSPATLSNNTTIPIAGNGGNCSDTYGAPPSTWSPLLSLSGGANVSFFQMSQGTSTPYTKGVAGTTVTSTQVNADFVHYSQTQLAAQYQSIFNPAASLGSCVQTITFPPNGSTAPPPPYTGLDAGSSVTLNAFNGTSIPLGKQPSTGFYQATGSTPFPVGAYTLTNGSGGTGVGAIGSIGITFPSFPTWTNQTTLGGTNIPRNTGLTITWSGGNVSGSSGYVDIQGSAGFGSAGNSTITFECTAPLSTGQFTVPAAILSSMPIAGTGSLQVGTNVGQILTVPSANLGAVSTTNVASVAVNWN